VALGFRVLEVEGAAKCFESVVVRLLKLGESGLELGGFVVHLLLEVNLVVAVFDDQAAVLEGASYAVEELVFFEGLQNVVVGAAADGFKRSGDIMDGSDHDDGDLGVKVA
jgi:hypothetical protein